MKHIMLDIETMGNGSNSAIISIGAVKFDINTGKTGETFHVKVSLGSSVSHGLNIDPSTVLWWMQQGEEARKKITEPGGVDLVTALSSFNSFCTPDYEIWGNSARFDLGILSDAYRKVGFSTPWDFRKERCVRTLVSFKPEVKSNLVFEGTAHDALDDCYHQIKYCTEIWKSLK